MERFRGLAVVAMLLGAVALAPQHHTIAQESRHLTGQFLVAAPEMGDPRFAYTVIYMINHSQEGAMGLVINRPVAQGPLSDLLKALGSESQPAKGTVTLHYGGPVQPERLFILHGSDYNTKDTTVVGDGVALTADVEIVQAIANGKGPRQSLFIFGYAGWAPGQLEGEIESGAWFSIPTEPSMIFDSDAESKWDKAMAKRKIKA